jgi:hypothetical protein
MLPFFNLFNLFFLLFALLFGISEFRMDKVGFGSLLLLHPNAVIQIGRSFRCGMVGLITDGLKSRCIRRKTAICFDFVDKVGLPIHMALGLLSHG